MRVGPTPVAFCLWFPALLAWDDAPNWELLEQQPLVGANARGAGRCHLATKTAPRKKVELAKTLANCIRQFGRVV